MSADEVEIECARCRRKITTDMAPAGTLSFCGECAPIVRPGLYADPAPDDISSLIYEMIASFSNKIHIANICLCLGPFAWRDLKLAKSPLLGHASPVEEPRFLGATIYEVFDAGSHAVYLRIGPPSRESRRPRG